MGIDYYKRIWASLFKLAGKNRKDADSTIDSREQQGRPMPDSDEEESNRWLGGDTGTVVTQHRVCGYKL